jgi:hypothetical protein
MRGGKGESCPPGKLYESLWRWTWSFPPSHQPSKKVSVSLFSLKERTNYHSIFISSAGWPSRPLFLSLLPLLPCIFEEWYLWTWTSIHVYCSKNSVGVLSQNDTVNGLHIYFIGGDYFPFQLLLFRPDESWGGRIKNNFPCRPGQAQL